jgi:hypothetical protein
VRFVHLAESSEKRADVVPLDVVTQRMTEESLSGQAVVMVQLD